MSTAAKPAPAAPTQTTRRVAVLDATLDQVLDRQRELVLQREYQPLGKVDFIYVVRGAGLLTMDFRKDGPRLAWNPDTQDFLLLSPWNGLPDLVAGEGSRCTSCLATCGDCNGKGTKACTLAGCGGSGQITTKFKLCPRCLGGQGKKTNPDCSNCRGRGEVVQPEKCPGCDANGQAKCFACGGEGKVATGREKGKSDYYDEGANRFVSVPPCKACNGTGRQRPAQPQAWQPFVQGRLQIQGQTMLALGPIQKIIWHTMDSNGKFQSCTVQPDRGGNLMVLLLESDQACARQYLVGGVPEIK
jgi:hypothetical protein